MKSVRKNFGILLFVLLTLPELSSYSAIFWSDFSRIQTEYRPEKLRIQTLFAQCFAVYNLTFQSRKCMVKVSRWTFNKCVKNEVCMVGLFYVKVNYLIFIFRVWLTGGRKSHFIFSRSSPDHHCFLIRKPNWNNLICLLLAWRWRKC